MMKDFWNSIINNIKNRVGTPFLSATLFSLIILNWESFLVIFLYSNEGFKYNNIDYTSALHFIDNNFFVWNSFYENPFLYGLIYALIIPLLTNLSKWYDKAIYSRFYESYKRWSGKYPKPEDMEIAEEELEKAVKENNIKQKSINELRKEIESLKEEKNNPEKYSNDSDESSEAHTDGIDISNSPKVEKVFDIIVSNSWIDSFLNIAKSIKNIVIVIEENQTLIDLLFEFDMISRSIINREVYEFTNNGLLLYDKILFRKYDKQ